MNDPLWKRLAWAGTGAACVLPVALIAGMTVGQRDAAALAHHDRQLAVRQCAPGSLPVLIVRDAAHPARDLWTCRSGSLRLAGEGR